MDTYKRPRRPTGRDDSKTRDKSPFELSVLLIEETWAFFNLIWRTRNDILNSRTGTAVEALYARITEQLLRYWRNQDLLLCHVDRILINFPHGVVVAWDRKRKKNMLCILDTCHKSYILEQNKCIKGQHKL